MPKILRTVNRWILAFSDIESCHLWRAAFLEHGLDYCRTGLWRKLNATPQFTGDRPAASAEAITIAHRKGKKEWNGRRPARDLGIPNRD